MDRGLAYYYQMRPTFLTIALSFCDLNDILFVINDDYITYGYLT